MQRSSSQIPLLTEEQKRGLMGDDTINFRVGYLYDDGSRIQRHLIAQVTTHVIYEYGAKIINQSVTRQTNAAKQLTNVSDSRNTAHLKDTSLSSQIPQEKQQTVTLMDIYNSLPEMKTHNGSHEGNNPLQACFIFKVALDNLPVEEIYKIFKVLHNNYRMMTYGRSYLFLPNKSRFLSDHAIYEFIYSYIHYNRALFSSLTTDKFDEKHLYNCVSIFGDFSSKLEPFTEVYMSRGNVIFNTSAELEHITSGTMTITSPSPDVSSTIISPQQLFLAPPPPRTSPNKKIMEQDKAVNDLITLLKEHIDKHEMTEELLLKSITDLCDQGLGGQISQDRAEHIKFRLQSITLDSKLKDDIFNKIDSMVTKKNSFDPQ